MDAFQFLKKLGSIRVIKKVRAHSSFKKNGERSIIVLNWRPFEFLRN